MNATGGMLTNKMIQFFVARDIVVQTIIIDVMMIMPSIFSLGFAFSDTDIWTLIAIPIQPQPPTWDKSKIPRIIAGLISIPKHTSENNI